MFAISSLVLAEPVSVTNTASGSQTIYTGKFVGDYLYIDSIANTAIVIKIKDGQTVKRVIDVGDKVEIPLYGLVFNNSIVIDWGLNTGNATVGGRKIR
jgi:hypothetical protein